MRSPLGFNLLKPVAMATFMLLGVGVLLTVLGIWDDDLNWHFFNGPTFRSLIISVWVLGGAGVALTVEMGILELIMILRINSAERLEKGQSGGGE